MSKNRKIYTVDELNRMLAKGKKKGHQTRGHVQGTWVEYPGKKKIYFRSKFEARYSAYLEWLKNQGKILEWEHEPKTFEFDGIRGKNYSYKPDFRVTEKTGRQFFIETKGWMDKDSEIKLKRMKKFFPKVEVKVAMQKNTRKLFNSLPIEWPC